MVVILEDQHSVVVAHTLLASYKYWESTHSMSLSASSQLVVVEILPELVNKTDKCKLAFFLHTTVLLHKPVSARK